MNDKKESDFINVGFGEVLDFISNDNFCYLERSMRYHVDMMVEEIFPHHSREEKILSIAYLLLNYRGIALISYLSKIRYQRNSDYPAIKKARICNIPLIEFSKIGNSDFSKELKALDFEEEFEDSSKNKGVLLEITKLLKIKSNSISKRRN